MLVRSWLVGTLVLVCLATALPQRNVKAQYWKGEKFHNGFPQGTARPQDVNLDLDCAIKALAFEYGQGILKNYSFSSSQLKAIFDALQLGAVCNQTFDLSVYNSFKDSRPDTFIPAREQDVSFYVDASNGNDNNAGTKDQPFQTVQRAVDATRTARSGTTTTNALIFLRAGTYFLPETVKLNSLDSNLVVQSYPGERAVISGGVSLTVNWKPYDKNKNIFVADVSGQLWSEPFTSLFVNGRRAIRARYPNGNPETSGLYTDPTGYISSAASWLPPAKTQPAIEIHTLAPARNGTHFPFYMVGIGGPVAAFNPPISFWGLANPVGGGASTYAVPTGLVWASNFTNNSWASPTTGIVMAFHSGYWGSWFFSIASRSDRTSTLTFGRGGFQEARGDSKGGAYYIDNIFEELDSPSEWFLDYPKGLLYYWKNETVINSLIATRLETLFYLEGTQANPIKNVRFLGLTFAHTRTTFMDSYEVPSGGDWSVHRGGTIFLTGVEAVQLSGNVFDSPGGNGLVISNYARNVVVVGNEFVWCGDSAILALGSTQGINGMDGNQPVGTSIVGNLIHEVGVFTKQTAGYFQALTYNTYIANNVMFNGPRSGINFNDGFGGGNLVEKNLLFNFVRETADHGPFNSWDRIPYLTTARDGVTPSLTPAESRIRYNFLINNYHSVWPIDHDDGSAYYTDTSNFLIYGGFKNYLGHSKIASGNVYVFPDRNQSNTEQDVGSFFTEPYCANSDGTKKNDSGWDDAWTSNICVLGGPVIYAYGNCDPTDLKDLVPFTANNQFFTPTATVQIVCGKVKWTLQEYQKRGYDLGSTVKQLPTNQQIIQWGRQVLNM